MKRPIIRLMHDDTGATALEYGLILALVVLVLMAALIALGGETAGKWNYVAARVTSAGN